MLLIYGKFYSVFFFQFEIKWQHIFLGLSNEINENNIVYNNIISLIACRIVNYAM